MKNSRSANIITTIILIACLAIAFVFFKAMIKPVDNNVKAIDRYTMNVKVFEITDEEIIFKAQDGNLWAIDNDITTNVYIGQNATLNMNNNGTNENIYDDIIENVNFNMKAN